MRNKDKILHTVSVLQKKVPNGVSASEISEVLNINRANVSRCLNELYSERKLEKIQGRPVLYKITEEDIGKFEEIKNNSLDSLIGAQNSLQIAIQQAKAAMLYPPRGLHTLILGETGVGKSLFAELMYKFSVETGMLFSGAPFIHFNCADYADNPQLLIAYIFGVKKGAYTGADKDREGLLKKADGGIIFLDEVHRLPPHGQEILFTFIDKGYFRALGETEKKEQVSVQIIAATTENPQSHLLKTFTRRIPMIITLPPLMSRGMKERYRLIELFIKDESKRLGKSIYINRNSLESFLLYDCPNNIGQLKSDIQLSCAKAFLNYKAQRKNYIISTQEDLPIYVKRGILKIKDNREQIDNILKNTGEILKFYYKEKECKILGDTRGGREDFYDDIERKLQDLKASGIQDNEINQILNIDIESHFKKHIEDMTLKVNREEIINIVGEKIVNVVDYILNSAQNKLYREYDENLYFALALHLNGSIKRIQNGNKIYNPKLNFIRAKYDEEFLIAMEMAKIIDNTFHIETPLDEIGYIAMFLAANSFELENEDKDKVAVLVIFHGNSTASSMVQVANELVGINHGVAIDMPLNMSAEEAYQLAKKKVQEINKGRGVLLLVDMGSLVNFGDMIYEETGIVVKTIDRVSTPMVIEGLRKAVLGRDLIEVYQSCKENNYFTRGVIRKTNIKKKNIIITACFTGDGAAERLKRVIYEKLSNLEDIEIIPMNIINRREFLSSIDYYRENYNILAIVGTVRIHIDDIQFISAKELLIDSGINTLKEIIEINNNYTKISLSLKEHLNFEGSDTVVEEVKQSVEQIETQLEKVISDEVEIGIIIHICFLIDKLKNGGSELMFKDLDEFIDEYSREITQIKQSLKSLEEQYDVEIGDNELAYICRMFMYNESD
ncbi:sigma 54-interacting transcriptional regulator [Clostridium faecium]|uniref:Sigma 54-interacting transcriptional regulator n=1 Tax=Clostridium faecium TaxID=2762223 RepID=A0ABR8YP99_9CLOT|nr:sigma-54-dependent transcriptional regulator [Clostridium faecium]MBD8046080.1 sigma 54-interacting transcriptional regulator [Clostridium faecium]